MFDRFISYLIEETPYKDNANVIADIISDISEEMIKKGIIKKNLFNISDPRELSCVMIKLFSINSFKSKINSMALEHYHYFLYLMRRKNIII